MRRDGPRDYERPTLTDKEILQAREVLQYAPDLVEIAKRRRAIYSVSRAVRAFCIWFIGFLALAIAFKQSVLDMLNAVKGWLK